MDMNERKSWVSRGFQDPVKAYRLHAANAGQRGIPFELTFAQWWALWMSHYENRGKESSQMCMCRTGDTGAYKVGNVRIDTIKANGEERSAVYRKRNTDSGRLPIGAQRVHSAPAQWLYRNNVFKPYVEEEEESY